MATAYKADTYADIQLTAPWGAAQTWMRPFSFNIANTTNSAGFVVNDTLALCPIPYKDGVYVVDFHIEIPSLDNGGNSVRLSIGDTNGTANAFQATWYSAVELGSNVASIANGTAAIGGSHVTTTWLVKNGTSTAVPKLYTVGKLYSGYTAWPTIDFMMKITTAPNTATTTGTISGYLMLQMYQGSTSGSF